MKTTVQVVLAVAGAILVGIVLVIGIGLIPLIGLGIELEREQEREQEEYRQSRESPSPSPGPSVETGSSYTRPIMADIEDYLATFHPREISADITTNRAGTRVEVELWSDSGDLDPELMLEATDELARIGLRHSATGGAVESWFIGDVVGTPVEVTGTATSNWEELSRILDAPASGEDTVLIELDEFAVQRSREEVDPGFCGPAPASQRREFHVRAAAEAAELLRGVGWRSADDPGLGVSVSACGGELDFLAEMDGVRRNDKIDALGRITEAVPASARVTVLRLNTISGQVEPGVRADSMLEVHAVRPDGQELAPTAAAELRVLLQEQWVFGPVTLNGAEVP